MAQKTVKQAAQPVQETNGAQAPQGPRIPRREVWMDLPSEYSGFKVKIWSNYPQRIYDQIFDQDLDEAGRVQALRKIVLEHNGWCDEEGNPLPAAQDDGFWEALPAELVGVVIMTIQEAASILPNSLSGRRRS